MTTQPTLSAALEAYAVSLLEQARALGLSITILPDGSRHVQGTTEPLRLAAIARQINLTAKILKELGT
jgi:hypothetical protein